MRGPLKASGSGHLPILPRATVPASVALSPAFSSLNRQRIARIMCHSPRRIKSRITPDKLTLSCPESSFTLAQCLAIDEWELARENYSRRRALISRAPQETREGADHNKDETLGLLPTNFALSKGLQVSELEKISFDVSKKSFEIVWVIKITTSLIETTCLKSFDEGYTSKILSIKFCENISNLNVKIKFFIMCIVFFPNGKFE